MEWKSAQHPWYFSGPVTIVVFGAPSPIFIMRNEFNCVKSDFCNSMTLWRIVCLELLVQMLQPWRSSAIVKDGNILRASSHHLLVFSCQPSLLNACNRTRAFIWSSLAHKKLCIECYVYSSVPISPGWNHLNSMVTPALWILYLCSFHKVWTCSVWYLKLSCKNSQLNDVIKDHSHPWSFSLLPSHWNSLRG